MKGERKEEAIRKTWNCIKVWRIKIELISEIKLDTEWLAESGSLCKMFILDRTSLGSSDLS